MKVTFDIPEVDIYTKELRTALQTAVDKVCEEYMENQEWPKEGDKYWSISTDGKVIGDVYFGCAYEDNIIAFGNIFKTKEEAEFHAERLKVMAELFKLTDDDKEWDDIQPHYILQYIPSCNDVYVTAVCKASFGQYHFASRESAEAAIEKIGNDRLIKYYFGIVEDEEC